MKIKNYIHELSQHGQHCFTSIEAEKKTTLSKSALRAALRRLQLKKVLASPYRGFYLIVPPHYEIYACLPAEQFVPDLMQYLKLPYYASILTAAYYYGAAHQKPQLFQVVTSKYLRPIICGQISISFITNKYLNQISTKKINTPTGYLRISTPEATAIDLIRYPQRAAGLNNITTVLIELAESINPNKLQHEIMSQKPDVVLLQRLGYLFDFINEKKLSQSIYGILSKKILTARPIQPGKKTRGSNRNKKWSLFINFNFEPDL